LIDKLPCTWFLSKGLERLYNVNDFAPAENHGRWLSGREIVSKVRTRTDRWVKLGDADQQATLNAAAEKASEMQPSIAALKGDWHGDVAMVLPGALQSSTKWKLNVPNSAALALNGAGKAYVFCRLSAAFSDPAKVELYAKVK
jgi:hypothetical protein